MSLCAERIKCPLFKMFKMFKMPKMFGTLNDNVVLKLREAFLYFTVEINSKNVIQNNK